jgi:hypothetical protein
MNKATLRTEETYKAYKDLIAAGGLEGHCALCDAPAIKQFGFWKLMVNTFPYDRIAQTHDMLIPLRHTKESDLTEQELKEYAEIKSNYLQEHYDFLIEATNKMKSIPSHFHLHVITLKQ